VQSSQVHAIIAATAASIDAVHRDAGAMAPLEGVARMGTGLGVVVLGLAAALLVVSMYLLPTTAQADEKGTFAPLVFTWLMIGTSLLCALVLAGYLFSTKSRPGR
jgi:predicted cobalt transporter CbtA